MLWLVPLLSLLGAATIIALRRARERLGAVALAATLATLMAAIWAAVARPAAGWPWGAGLGLTLAAEGPGRVMAVLVPAVAAPVIGYAAAARRNDPALARLLALLVAFIGAMELLVLAADLLTLLVAWELVGAISWALIAHDWRKEENVRAATWAFLATRFGDLGLYLAAGAAFLATGSFAFAALGGASGAALDVVTVGVLVAAAAKSAQVPFSPWLFAAMAGPTAVSALLHSATMVAAGAYLLVRLAPVLLPTGWFGPTVLALGLATALAGGVVAALQDDLKKALAASTSAQYGLMLVAVGAGVPTAAMVHLVNHAVFKALLFLGAGVAIHAAGTGNIGGLRLGAALPRTSALFGVGALALAAVPPLGGAYSKEQIVAAAATAGAWAAAGVLAAGVLSALYAGRLHLLAYGTDRRREAKRPDTAELLSLGVLAAAAVLLGLLWLPGGSALVEEIAGGGLARGEPWELAASIATVAGALGLAWALWRRGALQALGVPERARAVAADWLGLPAATRPLVARPVIALAAALARLDERVVDAGVRLAGRAGRALSRLLSWRGELGIDGLVKAVTGGTRAAAAGSHATDERVVDPSVEGVARATSATAAGSRLVDDHAVDRAVEGVAHGIGFGGNQSRRLQTGLAHQYYVIVAVGAVVAILIAALWR